MQIPTFKSPPLNIKKNSIINIKPKTIKEDFFEESKSLQLNSET